MRPLEILLALLLAAILLAPFFKRRAKFLPPLAIIVNILHLWLEGYRWQMIPLYGIAAALALASLPSLLKSDAASERPRGWRAAASFLTLGLVAASAALPALLPVPRIATPTGKFQVGTQSFVLTDASRRELYSGRDEPRKFMIQVWYPAAPRKDDVRAPWVNNADAFARTIAVYFNFPEFFLNHLTLAKSPAHQDAPVDVSAQPYPVIVFSHGWNGFAAQSTAQMVELASHGFFVISMQHTYGAMVTIFPDGEVAPNNPDALPEEIPDPSYTDAARLLVNQWSGDIAFALDFAAAQSDDASSPFLGADLTRIGLFGHSTGGGAVIQFCGVDSRCLVGMAEDPFMTPVSQEVQERGLSQSFLFMFSQEWRDITDSKNNRLFNAFLPKVANSIGVTRIVGTRHYDFTDLPLLSPLAPQLKLKGPINGARVVEILNDYLVAFFEQELYGIPSPLPFDNSDDYPELRWETQ
ncbi:MAG: hypothetical protein HY867_19590 [Chloroflexi bacterium]|nr:hypothetical protein [Chloroflexota bacterium]